MCFTPCKRGVESQNTKTNERNIFCLKCQAFMNKEHDFDHLRLAGAAAGVEDGVELVAAARAAVDGLVGGQVVRGEGGALLLQLVVVDNLALLGHGQLLLRRVEDVGLVCACAGHTVTDVSSLLPASPWLVTIMTGAASSMTCLTLPSGQLGARGT